MIIPFGEWRPDAASLDSVFATEALNVVPSEDGYRPLLKPQTPIGSTFTSARPQGAISVRDISGTIHNFCGDATKLYKLNSGGTAWTDVSRTVGGAYATPATGWWSFSQFGNYIMADNGIDAAQVFQLGSSSNFAALGGSSPVAKFSAIVRNFAVKANVSGANTRVQWSEIENHAAWASGGTSLADSQTLPDGGQVMGIVGGEYGVVFQERAIQRMSFEGPPIIFRFDVVSNVIGCRVERSIASYGDIAFFLSQEGFYQIVGGQQLTAIGNGKVDRYIEANLSETYRDRCSAAIDPINKLYCFLFQSQNSTGAPDSMMIYHWPTGKWSHAGVSLYHIFPAYVQSGYTLDTLDTLSASLDAMTVSLDSATLAGGNRLNFCGLNIGSQMSFFVGSRLPFTIETGSFQLSPGRKSMLRGVRPIIEGNSGLITQLLCRPYTKDHLFDPWVAGDESQVNANMYCPMRVNARYHKIRVQTRIRGASDVDFQWDHALGIDDMKFSTMGAR